MSTVDPTFSSKSNSWAGRQGLFCGSNFFIPNRDSGQDCSEPNNLFKKLTVNPRVTFLKEPFPPNRRSQGALGAEKTRIQCRAGHPQEAKNRDFFNIFQMFPGCFQTTSRITRDEFWVKKRFPFSTRPPRGGMVDGSPRAQHLDRTRA